MNVDLKVDGVMVAVGLVVVVAGVVYWNRKAIAETVTETAETVKKSVNPADSENLVNRGFVGLYQWATGSKGTPAGDLYDALHPEDQFNG